MAAFQIVVILQIISYAAGAGRIAYVDRQCSATLGTATSLSRLIAN